MPCIATLNSPQRSCSCGSAYDWKLRARSGLPSPTLQFHQPSVGLRAAIAEELPHVPHFADLVEIQLGRHELIPIPRRLRYELTTRVAEVALPVELADPPRVLVPDPIDRTHEERVRNGVRRLLELPQILGQPRHRCRRVEHDLRAIEPELAGALGKMTVVTDVHAHVRITSLEDRIPEVAGPEVELLPEARRTMREVVLAVFAEVRAVRVDDGGGVVVDPGAILLVQRDDDDHLVLLRDVLHEARGGSIGNALHRVVPSRALLGAEVRAGEDLLHAQDLDALASGLLDEAHVFREVRFADGLELLGGAAGVAGLDQTALYDSWHGGVGVVEFEISELLGSVDSTTLTPWRTAH